MSDRWSDVRPDMFVKGRKIVRVASKSGGEDQVEIKKESYGQEGQVS
jgi:hypothetical protein